MAKTLSQKFFNERVYNKKRTIINTVIIGGCAIGVIICFIFVSTFGKNELVNNGKLNIKKSVTVEVNEKYSKDIFFSKVENINLDEIKLNYAIDYDITKIGSYKVSIIVDDEEFISTINVVDTTKPDLTLKRAQIKENGFYTISDFVIECKDNSGTPCKIDFCSNCKNEEGSIINYKNYKKNGNYEIKVTASDTSGNKITKSTYLVIGDGNNITQTNCKYGSSSYLNSNYILAVNISTNGCAINKTNANPMNNEEIKHLIETEKIKISRELLKLNLKGALAINHSVNTILNSTNEGAVGYELEITVNLTTNNKHNTIAKYRVNTQGKRIYSVNTYNLPN